MTEEKIHVQSHRCKNVERAQVSYSVHLYPEDIAHVKKLEEANGLKHNVSDILRRVLFDHGNDHPDFKLAVTGDASIRNAYTNMEGRIVHVGEIKEKEDGSIWEFRKFENVGVRNNVRYQWVLVGKQSIVPRKSKMSHR